MTNTAPTDAVEPQVEGPAWPHNYPPETIYRQRMKIYIEHQARLLLREAESLGLVLSITQRHVDPIPAIGRTINEVIITPKRILS